MKQLTKLKKVQTPDDLLEKSTTVAEYKAEKNHFPINEKKLSSRQLFHIRPQQPCKKSFIIELNKFISIYRSVTYFDEKKNNLIELISPRKSLEFEIEQDSFKENLTCQITKVSRENAEITEKKFLIQLFQIAHKI